MHPAGYGFVLTAEGEFFIPAKHMKGAFDGDEVEVAPMKVDPAKSKAAERDGGHDRDRAAGRRDGKVVAVLTRAHTSIVGRVELAEPFAVVVPADPHITHDIFTMHADAPDVPDGAVVRVAMVTYPDRNAAATGVITEVLATDSDAAAVDMILARYHVDEAFSEGALAEAREARLDVEGALARGYRDLRQRVVFTIDPEDAKDYDDAVSFEVREDGARMVGVHIADVSAYVPWDSALDVDARRRATSVYAVDRVVPMLPEELSNGLCSLVAGEDRLTMTVDMVLDGASRVVSADIYPAVIRSTARLTYAQAQAAIAGDTPEGMPAQVAERILALNKVARQRVALASARGALDFDRAEAKVQLDGTGTPTGVILRRKTDATSLIEECMIMANVAVAEFLVAKKQPAAFRVHEAPDADSLAALIPVFAPFAFFRLVDRELFCMGEPATLRRTLELARGTEASEVVSMAMLRAMKRAVYKPACEGHFGLALEQYCHFTSPIRRYPDLIVHRAVKAALGRPVPGVSAQTSALPALCAHSSQMETVAEECARETQELKLIEYLGRFVGETFDGIISGVTVRGLYVRLENTAEGMLSTDDMGREYYSLDVARQCLTGESTGAEYHLGDPIRVLLAEADPHTRTLGFKRAR